MNILVIRVQAYISKNEILNGKKDRNMETENQNSLSTVHLNIKAYVYNKHICTKQPTKMWAL